MGFLQQLTFTQKDGKGEIPVTADADVADQINRAPAEGTITVEDKRVGAKRTINRETHPSVKFGDLEPE